MALCGWLAGVILAITLLLFLYLLTNKHTHARFFTPLYVTFAGCFLAVFLLMLPIVDLSSIQNGLGAGLRVEARIMLALHNTLQVFTIDVGAHDILASIREEMPGYSAYFIMMSVLMLVCPVLTLSFILSFAKSVSSYFRLLFCYGRDWYVFSELNERSITLARDIRGNHRDAAIIFTDVFGGKEEASFELLESAKEVGAICFNKDIVSIAFRPHAKKAKTVLFTIGYDETENVDQALKLLEILKENGNVRIFVFSKRVDGEMLLTKADKGKVKVRRVNEVRALINRHLYYNGRRLFESAGTDPDGTKRISAVLIGLGGHGTEMLKALTWYCQMDGFRIEIDAFDLDEKAEDRFFAAAPDLMRGTCNGANVPEEAQYAIRIHSGFDVTTKTFADALTGLDRSTYVFISLGSDEANIRTAVEVRMRFERMRIRPVIQTVIYNSDAKKALTGITNYRGQPYDVDFIGDLSESFSEAVILNSELEADALRRHMEIAEEESFWQYEYNYNSSIACSIHAKARLEQGIPGAGKKESEMTEEERRRIERLEHRRWNAYMRAEGYIYSGSPDKRSRNDLAKMHPDLVDYSSLSEEDKRKNGKVGMD